GRTADVRSEHNIQIAISIQVSDVHGVPSSGDAFRKCARFEIHPAGILEINETFARRFLVVGKKRNRGDIEVAIAIKIARHRLDGSVQWKEIAFFETI